MLKYVILLLCLVPLINYYARLYFHFWGKVSMRRPK